MNDYQKKLNGLMDQYVHLTYSISKKFPKEEIYGVTSQLRRSSLSVVLNYIEGYARRKTLTRLNFLEISYGSLMESDYLLDFSLEEMYIIKENYDLAKKLSKEIGAMLWTEISNIDKSLD